MPPFASYTDSIRFGYRINTVIDPVFHSHPRYEVFYFHEGNCNYLIGDKIYSLSPGDLILMNGMTLHCAKIDPGIPYIRSIVHYNSAVIKPFLEPQHALNILGPFQELGNHRISLRGKEKEETERMLHHMHSLYTRQDQIGYNRFLLSFVDFLYYIYEHCQTSLKDMVEHTSEKERTVQRIISFIERNYAEDLHLEQLQEHLHLSKFYMPKIFKEITGVTIFDFLYQRRINQAKIQFILNPALSVTEVSFQVGFKHLAHFSRIFKQQVGLTPEQYKKSVRTAVT